jgi:hypothetical protein
MNTKKCVICGKEFTTNHNQITCSVECSKERKRELNRTYHRTYVKPKEVLPKANLDEEIAKANKLGISYGEYKARQFLFREKAKELADGN